MLIHSESVKLESIEESINRAYVLAKEKGILVWGASPEWAFVMGYLAGIEWVHDRKKEI